MGKRRLAIIGSTGSIGRQTLEIVDLHPELFEVVILTCNTNTDLLEQQVKKYKPAAVCIGAEGHGSWDFAQDDGLFTGEAGLSELLSGATVSYDIAVNAVVGIAGLLPTLAVIDYGLRNQQRRSGDTHKVELALANKESLVVGGNIVMSLARDAGVQIIPVDSEHSALMQSIGINPSNSIEKLTITASGGPFMGMSREELQNKTITDALNHPNWSMGNKITVDSATMINKAFEIIEAKWLFDIPSNKIEAVIHPQSIVHGMAEFADGAVIAQLGTPTMLVPIAYALLAPEREKTGAQRLDLTKIGILEFQEITGEAKRAIDLAYKVLHQIEEEGLSSSAVVMNAADEVLVERFIKGEIRFTDIIDGVECLVDNHKPLKISSVEKIFVIDAEARESANSWIAARRPQ
jgi:1-deoxy-D-xylulose-5-phosphate reductoisomerase